MKPKMLMPYAASRVVAWPVAKAMEEQFEVDVVYIWGEEAPPPYEVELEQPNLIGMKDINLAKYDVVLGFDPSTLGIVIEAKRHGILAGCTILDIPFHVFEKNRDYNESITQRWVAWKGAYDNIDFIVSWREYTETIFTIPHLTLFAPTDPPPLSKDQPHRENFFVYSGIVRPDKGVHNIIDAISLLEGNSKLVVVGAGHDLSDYAKYLNVLYEQTECSQVEKYELYRKALAVVSYSDNQWIPPLSPLEAISIGVRAIAADGKEAKRLYGEHAHLVPMNNNWALAGVLNQVRKLPVFPPFEKSIDFWKNNRTHAIYAQKTYDFIKEML